MKYIITTLALMLAMVGTTFAKKPVVYDHTGTVEFLMAPHDSEAHVTINGQSLPPSGWYCYHAP